MHIAIIGKGFSGICTAYELIRHYRKQNLTSPLRILFIDTNNFGGNTYNRSDVNVGMANPLRTLGIPHEQHALEQMQSNYSFWKQHIPPTHIADKNKLSEQHITHNAYGIYLRSFIWELMESLIQDQTNIELISINEKAMDLDLTSTDHWKVTLENGSELTVDKLILATGNVEPQVLNKIQSGKYYYNLDDLGTDKTHASETDEMVIIGMGNGAHYAALNAFNNGFNGVITLVSKNGYKPIYRQKDGSKNYQPQFIVDYKIAKIIENGNSPGS